MKRIIIFIFAISLAGVILSSCGVDFYAGKRPTNYLNTKWVSKMPDMYFEVVGGKHSMCASGQITIGNVTTEVEVIFDFGTGVNFNPPLTSENELDYYKYFLFSGSCKFSERKLVVTINDNSKGFLDDLTKEIVFVREDIAE